MVTGIELVKSQIRSLPAKNWRIVPRFARSSIRGHALECRINVEHPEKTHAFPRPHHRAELPGGSGVRDRHRGLPGRRDPALLRFAEFHFDACMAKIEPKQLSALCRVRWRCSSSREFTATIPLQTRKFWPTPTSERQCGARFFIERFLAKTEKAHKPAAISAGNRKP